MIKKIIFRYWELFVIFLCSLAPVFWLGAGEVILGHDSGFRLDPLQYLQRVWFSWDPFVKTGIDLSNYKGFLVALLPESFFVRLAGSLATGQTLNFIFWFFVMGSGMYLCLMSFFPDRKYWPFRLFASIFYMYNFFLLQAWFITERAKFSLFAALPILVVISYKLLNKNISILKGSILFGLTLLLLNGGGSPPLYGGVLVSQFILVLFFTGRALLRRQYRDIFSIFLRMTSCILVTIIFNAYWFVPQAYVGLTQYSGQLAGMGGFNGILAWENVVSRYASFINLLRLQGIPDWYDNPLHPYSQMYETNPLLIIASFLPAAAVLFVLFRKHLWKPYIQYRKFFTICLLLLLLGLIMTAGSHPPTGFLYVTLLRYIPGFLIFRTAFYKFGPVVWFSLIVLSSFSFYVLISRYIRNRILYAGVALLIIVGLLAYHFPYFTGNFFVWNKPFSTKVKLPSYVSDMFSYLNTTRDPDATRTMMLPPLDENFHADGYTWGFWGLDLLPKLGARVPIVANDGNSPMVNGLYSAAMNKDVALFMDLTNRMGIYNVLWRNDVLYADKTTTSNNFRYIQDFLLAHKAITEEKHIGEWTLYNIRQTSKQSNLMSIQTAMYRVDVDPSLLHELFGNVPLKNVPIVVGESLRNFDLEKRIEPFVQGNIYAASCAFCDPSELHKIENMFPNLYTRFLPDSPLYALIAWKEDRILRHLASTPSDQIDAHLAYATKRLAEVWGLIDRDIKDNTDSLALKSFVGFKEHIDKAIGLLPQLDEINKNAYKARIGAYLKFYTKYLARIDEKNILPKNYISTLYEYLSAKIHGLSEDLWITSALSNQKFYLVIPNDDTYELKISSQMGNPTEMNIDNEILTQTSAVHLTSGVHKISLVFAPHNAIATGSGGVSADIPLTYGQQRIFEISEILSENKYLINFNYRVTKGKSIYMAFHQDNDAKDAIGNIRRVLVEPLKDDGVWHSAEYVIQPNFGAQKGEVVFFTADSTDEESSVSISDLIVQNIKPANIFAMRHNTIISQKIPDISYKSINPALVTATISDAAGPHIIQFKQSYDSGWKLYIVPQAQKYGNVMSLLSLLFKNPVSAKNHFALDTIANAWYIDATGSYDVVVVYLPYIIFLISLGVTSISVCVGFIFLLRNYGRK